MIFKLVLFNDFDSMLLQELPWPRLSNKLDCLKVQLLEFFR